MIGIDERDMDVTEEEAKDFNLKVQAGVKWLDTIKPDWYKEIDLEKLNVRSHCDCVLGQLNIPLPLDAIELGFDLDDEYGIFTQVHYVSTKRNAAWHYLTLVWRDEIGARLDQDSSSRNQVP